MESPESSDHEHEALVLLPTILARLEHLDLTAYIEFKEARVVCAGAYGDVSKQRCTLPNRGRIKVAVKRLRFYMKGDIISLFEKEIYVWSKLDHSNVLPLLGFAFDEKTGYPLLVSEWMKNGSVWDYVHTHTECDLIHLVTGIADGLAYLHKQGVVHSDIKSTNILVSDSGDAVIADFGCARMLDASMSMANLSSGLKGTTRYLAYELLALQDCSTGYSEKTDVWAFGMTVFELFTFQRPYQHLKETHIALAIVEFMLPALPASCPWEFLGTEERDRLWDICQICWIHNPAARPNMETIVEMLRKPRWSRDMNLTQEFLLKTSDQTATMSSVYTGDTLRCDPARTRYSSVTKVSKRTLQIGHRTWTRLRAMFSLGPTSKTVIPIAMAEDGKVA